MKYWLLSHIFQFPFRLHCPDHFMPKTHTFSESWVRRGREKHTAINMHPKLAPHHSLEPQKNTPTPKNGILTFEAHLSIPLLSALPRPVYTQDPYIFGTVSSPRSRKTYRHRYASKIGTTPLVRTLEKYPYPKKNFGFTFFAIHQTTLSAVVQPLDLGWC